MRPRGVAEWVGAIVCAAATLVLGAYSLGALIGLAVRGARLVNGW